MIQRTFPVRRAAALAASMLAAAAFGAAALLAPVTGPGDDPPPPWRVVGLPGQTKPFTHFSSVALDGQRALRIEAASSYGNLVHPIDPSSTVRTLSWRWRVDEPNPQADLSRRDGDDTPVKVCALFDLPLDAVPFVERQLLRVARLRAGDDLTAANVCYVWDSKLPPGTVLDNAFTRRMRYIVLRGPEAPLRTWVADRRDFRADFLRLFADESHGTVPALVGIAIGADADNTKQRSVAHVSDVVLN